MAATIKDVARGAGVAQATAARALGGYGYVSEDARRRVLAAAERLDYRANNAARTLVMGTSKTIGFVVGDIENVFFAATARGLADTLDEAGYTLLVANSDEDTTRERRAINSLQGHRVDGLVVAPADSLHSPHLHNVGGAAAPLVLLDRTVRGLQVDSVVTDGVSGAELAVEYLIAHGHKRIGLIIDNLDTRLSSMTGRLRGWRNALRRAGLPADDSLIATPASRYADAADEVTGELLTQHRPTAIFSASNLMTLSVLRVVKELGLRVPRDVSIVAFDDMEVLSLVDPGITAVAQPARELGEVAGQLLLDRMRGVTQRPRRIKLAPALLERGSTGPARPVARRAVRSPPTGGSPRGTRSPATPRSGRNAG